MNEYYSIIHYSHCHQHARKINQADVDRVKEVVFLSSEKYSKILQGDQEMRGFALTNI